MVKGMSESAFVRNDGARKGTAGLALVRVSFYSLCLLSPLLVFSFTPFLDLLLIISVNAVYIPLPHTILQIPHSFFNQLRRSGAFTIQIFFLPLRSCLRYTWMMEHYDDE